MNGWTSVGGSLLCTALTSFGFAAPVNAVAAPLALKTQALTLTQTARGLRDLGEFDEAMAALSEIESLPVGWDGYDAEAINADVIANARWFLHAMSEAPGALAPDITPNPNGTLTFEWQSADGYAVLEIGITRVSFFSKPAQGAGVRFDGVVSRLSRQDVSGLARYAAAATTAAESQSSVVRVNVPLYA